MLSRMSDEEEEKAKVGGESKDEGIVLLEQTNQLLVSHAVCFCGDQSKVTKASGLVLTPRAS